MESYFEKEVIELSKKVKIIGGTLVVLALAVAGAVGIVATASAADPTPTPTSSAVTPQADLLARVAEILGIDKQKVTDAFTQARQEMAQKAFQNALDRAVANGKITQVEADQILQWWKQKPEVLNKGLLPGLKGGFGGRMRGGCIFWGKGTATPAPSTS